MGSWEDRWMDGWTDTWVDVACSCSSLTGACFAGMLKVLRSLWSEMKMTLHSSKNRETKYERWQQRK